MGSFLGAFRGLGLHHPDPGHLVTQTAIALPIDRPLLLGVGVAWLFGRQRRNPILILN